MFHFNKGHLTDQTIPMWVLKTKGESYYVHHVDCQMPWSTKETPDNLSTKGSLKIKKCLLTINNANEATISELTIHDETRLRNAEKGITRIIVKEGQGFWKLKETFANQKIKHGPIKSIGGACSSTFYITDILDKKSMPFLQLAMADTDMRELMPNEGYYKVYDDPKYAAQEHVWEEDLYEEDEDDIDPETELASV